MKNLKVLMVNGEWGMIKKKKEKKVNGLVKNYIK